MATTRPGAGRKETTALAGETNGRVTEGRIDAAPERSKLRRSTRILFLAQATIIFEELLRNISRIFTLGTNTGQRSSAVYLVVYRGALPMSTERQSTLPVYEWTGSGSGPLASLRQPALVVGAPNSAWPALRRWRNPALLSSVLPRLHVWNSSTPSFTFFKEDGELGVRTGTRPGTSANHSVVHGSIVMNAETYMSAEDLVAASKSAGSMLYASVDLRDIKDEPEGQRALSDLQPLAPLIVANEVPLAHEPSQAPHPVVWLQTQGATSHAHYDPLHNLFTQVAGRKRIWLWPPDAHVQMRLFPSLHSSDRQSQLAVPHSEVTPAFDTILNPGDLLYLPPYWFHQLQVVDEMSVSVAQWSQVYDMFEIDTTKLDGLPLPWGQRWDTRRRALAAKSFLRHVLAASYGSAHAAQAAVQRLVEDYGALKSRPALEQEELLHTADDTAMNACALDAPPAAERVGSAAQISTSGSAEAVSHVLRSIGPQGSAVTELYRREYIQRWRTPR